MNGEPFDVASGEDWAARLYGQLPAVYRIRDLEIARQRSSGADDTAALTAAPLMGLLRAIADSVAMVRQNMDDLWDDFFIETCSDRIVPYLGALVAADLSPRPVGQSSRLEVYQTIAWRRTKGTPAMLAAVAQTASGWPAELVEVFRTLAWTQNLNHLRPDRSAVLNIRDPGPLRYTGLPGDPAPYLADIRTPRDLDLPRLVPGGSAPAWGPPGGRGVDDVTLVVAPLRIFRLRGITPAPSRPGEPEPPADQARAYHFDPLRREVALFSAATASPISRADAAADLGQYFGSGDIMIRRHGVPLAAPIPGETTQAASPEPFTFGDPAAATRLHPREGLRLLEPARFGQADRNFLVRARWSTAVGERPLGSLATLLLAQQGGAYRPGLAFGGPGQLTIRLETGAPDADFSALPAAGPGRFPATVLAVRDDRTPIAARQPGGEAAPSGVYQNALLVWLPDLFIRPGEPVDLAVGADGSTWYSSGGQPGRLARTSMGQVWPPVPAAAPSTRPADPARGVHRYQGLLVADQSRYAGRPGVLIEAYQVTGAAPPQLLGGLPTGDVPLDETTRGLYGIPPDELTWPAFTFRASLDALLDLATPAALDSQGPASPSLLAVRIRPADPRDLASDPVVAPQSEVIITDRAGDALLAYLPELTFTPGSPDSWLLLADDGSSYRRRTPAGADPAGADLAAADLARAATGQVLPIEDAYPLRRRVPVNGPPGPGEIGIDAPTGRFCLEPDDPLISVPPHERGLTVDYIEAFSDRIGARPGEQIGASAGRRASRVVSASGDALADVPPWRIHRTLAEAVVAATDDDVIEIADSRTYSEPVVVDLSDRGRPQTLTIRAGGEGFERPCLASGDVTVLSAADAADPPVLALEGLLVGGARVVIEGPGTVSLGLTACTLDPPGPGVAALLARSQDTALAGQVRLTSCLTGALHLAGAVRQLAVSDSIVDGGPAGLAIGAPPQAGGPDAPAASVQLERVTVIGRVRCHTLVASNSLLTSQAVVDDQQSGCVRYSRIEPGSTLPRRFRCVPAEPVPVGGDQARPAFSSRLAASFDYGRLGPASSPLLRTASDSEDEVGAFAASLPSTRLTNLRAQLAGFLPVGLRAHVSVRT
jgi:hypothetical protein